MPFAEDSNRYVKPESYSIADVPLPDIRENDVLVTTAPQLSPSLNSTEHLATDFLTFRSRSRRVACVGLTFISTREGSLPRYGTQIGSPRVNSITRFIELLSSFPWFLVCVYIPSTWDVIISTQISWALTDRYSLGHEVVGVVAAVGARVKRFSIGDRVVADNSELCGECSYCLRGQELFCENFEAHGVTLDGGFAEYCAYPGKLCIWQTFSFDRFWVGSIANNVFKIKNLSNVNATLIEPASCAVHGIDRLAAAAGSSILLFGAGPTGLVSPRSHHNRELLGVTNTKR